MLNRGVESLSESTRKHFRRKLEQELKDSIDIVTNDGGKLLMVPDCITKTDLVLENDRLQKQINSLKVKSSNFDKTIDQTAAHIRTTIKEEVKPTPWPIHPSDINTDSEIPRGLERFFIGLLTGDPDNTNYGSKTRCLIQSFSQDIIYAVSNGQHKPAKHLLIPNEVKTLTGNSELIHILNKLGHGVSYSQLEENDTAPCLQKLEANSDQKVVLPSSIKPYVFTNLAWDNIDRLEETMTGKGTYHRVNGIAVQASVYGPFLPKEELPHIEKLKQRSVNVDHRELGVYVAGSRVGPQPLKTNQNRFGEQEYASELACKKDLLWIISRVINTESQTVPSWTGFNIATRSILTVPKDTVGYLPTINAPATELSTVFEILNQSEAIRKELSLESTVVVFYKAIYAKATEIAWKHKERFSNILLRLGVFHTICNILSILGKRFRDAGLRDICIESEIVAEGSINAVLDGKHYNRAVRIHKYIFEGLMRLVWSNFIIWLDQSAQSTSEVYSFLDEAKEFASDMTPESLTCCLKVRACPIL